MSCGRSPRHKAAIANTRPNGAARLLPAVNHCKSTSLRSDRADAVRATIQTFGTPDIGAAWQARKP
jgi:hypothetical protein